MRTGRRTAARGIRGRTERAAHAGAPSALGPHAWSVFEGIQTQPEIAYAGVVGEGVRDMRVRHSFYTWWWVRRGRAEIRTREGSCIISRGRWLLIAPWTARRQLLDRGTDLISLSFHLEWPLGGPVLEFEGVLAGGAAQRRLRDRALAAVRVLDSGGARGNVPFPARRLGVAGWLRFRAAFDAFLEALVETVAAMGAVVTAPAPRDPRFERVVREIAEAPRAGPLPFARWERETGMGRARLDRMAERHWGRPLAAWRNERLAREIRRRLMPEGVLLKAVAAELGFVDAAHFNRWVRRHLGAAPSALRGNVA